MGISRPPLANRFTSVLKNNHVSSLLIIKPTLFLWSIERCDFRSSITVKLSLLSVKPYKPQNLPGSEKPAKQLPSTFVFKTQLCSSDSSVKIVIRVSWDSLLKDVTQPAGQLGLVLLCCCTDFVFSVQLIKASSASMLWSRATRSVQARLGWELLLARGSSLSASWTKR